MEVITIDSRAFKLLMAKLNELTEYVYSVKHTEEDDDNSWVDSHEVCDFLKISERTLQRLRSDGKITYTSLSGKNYYQISQVKKMLRERLVKSTEENLEDLIQYHKQREEQRKGTK